jgi:hypothetical protein
LIIMTAVYAHWYDTSVVCDPSADLERFDSLCAAREAFAERYTAGWSPVRFDYVNRSPETSAVPCVSEQCEMLIYFADPRDTIGDPYPDRRLSLGPRGGVVAEPC